MIDQIIDDIRRTHIILNAEAGHGKSSALRTIIKKLKEREPKTIVKVFDVSQAWYHRAPVPHRQRITPEKMFRVDFLNLNDCVYEIGGLSTDLRRVFVALIVNQDYKVRYEMGMRFGIEAVNNLPLIVYVFEESDTYFDSAQLNKKDEAGSVLRDFVKVGRNFKLRAFCVATAAVGELATKLRRRSKHLIGKIISDSDYREYNRMSRNKIPKGEPRLGDMATGLERFHWIYYNGDISEPFYIPDLVKGAPVDYVAPPRQVVKVPENVKESRPRGYWSRFFVGFGVGVVLLWLASHFWRLYS